MSCSFVGWCALDGEAQAAWTQAVLSVLAIVVAVLIPLRQHKSDRAERGRDRLARQKAMALAVLPALTRIEREIRGFYDYAFDSTTHYLESKGFEDLTEVPAALKTFIPTLHELGDACDKVTEVVAALTKAHDTLLEWRESVYATGHPHDLEDRVHENLRSARDLAKAATRELYALFDGA